MKILVVIPTYNEVLTVQVTISRVLELHPELSVLVVDDNSPDGTGNLIQKLAKEDDRISFLSREQKQGLGDAYLAGFAWAFEREFDFVVEMDADGSHRPEDLGRLLDASSRADLVIGSRWIAGGNVLNWPAARQLISRFGNGYARFMLGTKISDMTSGFRVYRTGFLKELVNRPVASHGYSFQVELAYRGSTLGTVVEIPITFVERVNGQSKMTLAIVLEALAKVTLWGIKKAIG